MGGDGKDFGLGGFTRTNSAGLPTSRLDYAIAVGSGREEWTLIEQTPTGTSSDHLWVMWQRSFLRDANLETRPKPIPSRGSALAERGQRALVDRMQGRWADAELRGAMVDLGDEKSMAERFTRVLRGWAERERAAAANAASQRGPRDGIDSAHANYQKWARRLGAALHLRHAGHPQWRQYAYRVLFHPKANLRPTFEAAARRHSNASAATRAGWMAVLARCRREVARCGAAAATAVRRSDANLLEWAVGAEAEMKSQGVIRIAGLWKQLRASRGSSALSAVYRNDDKSSASGTLWRRL